MRALAAAILSATIVSPAGAEDFRVLLKTNPANSNLYARIEPCRPLGFVVAWPDSDLPTHLLGAVDAVDTAFETWEDLTNHVSINIAVGNMVTLYIETGWPEDLDEDDYAATLPAYTASGLFSFSMHFNMDNADNDRHSGWWTTAAAVQSNQIHMPTVALHEAGHVMGLDLGDGYEVNYASSATVMAGYVLGTVATVPTSWDRLAIAFLYGNDVCGLPDIPINWGGIKSMYSGYAALSGAVSLSGEDNTIAWNRLPGDTARTYFVYRGEGSDEELTLLGTTFGDSLFIDDDVEFGEEYRYHVASADSTTLLDIGLGRTGLKQVSSTILTAELEDLDSAQGLVVRGNKLFASSFDRIVRLNISDPSSPVITGSRTDAVFDSGPKLLALSSDGAKLYVATYTGFVVLDATSPGLAILGTEWNLVTGDGSVGDSIIDILVDDEIVYLACGQRGLYAIDVHNPGNPQIAGIHDAGAETAWVTAVERVGDYLYVKTVDWSPLPHVQERLVVTKTPPDGGFDHWDVAFTVDCSTVDGCLDDELWVARNSGKAKGVLAVGTDNTDWVGIDLSRPTSPTNLRPLRSPVVRPSYVVTDPFGSPVDTVSFVPSILSYDVDSRYIYATTPVWWDKLDRSLVVFDPWAEGPDGLFATGDTLGYNYGGIVKSQGKYLYILDDFNARGDGEDGTRLRVFEKANGCKPDPDNPVRLFPDQDAFKLDEELVTAWAIGCPIGVVVEVVEDGLAAVTVDAQTYAIADDVANSASWTVDAMSQDMENHTYQVKITATYESGPPATFYSQPFRIEVGSTREVATNGSKPYTSVQAAINASASGDTVLVYAGDYNEHLALRSNVRVVGKPGARIVPTTSGAAVAANGLVHPPTLDGIEFRFAGGINETALDVDDCGVRVRNCTFASLERAVEVTNGYGTFTGCTFVDNNDPSVGGAVWINSAATGQTTFTDCIFEGNTAGSYGGAVWISTEGTYSTSAPQIAFVGCTFKDNSAALTFATVRVGDNTRPSFENCIFADNQVVGTGAVVGGTGGASAYFKNCTFADNSGTGAFEVLSIVPLAGAAAITIDACVFAGNAGARAISSTHGSSYVVSNSDFYGNATGDAESAASGANNFSADPAFCGPGDYSIMASSPCVAGITAQTLVGALDVGCVPSAIVAVVPGTPVVGCPEGDADSLVVQVDFDNAAMTREIAADELSIEPPYGTRGIWSTSSIVASEPASQPEFITTFRHRNVSGTGTDSVAIQLNGYSLTQRAIVQRRGFDYSGDGLVNVIDYAAFAIDYPSPPKTYMSRSDFTNDGAVDVQDFAKYAAHNGHQKPFSGDGYMGNSVPESPVVVSLRFEEDDPLLGRHRMKAIVSLENPGLFRATLITLRNDNPQFKFVEWHPHEAYPHLSMATDLTTRESQKVIMIGATGSKEMTASWVELGYFDIEVLTDEPLEPKAEDFELLGAEMLTMDSAAQNVPKGNSRRSYSAPVYRNELRQNYPNPFNPTTTIAFSLERASQAEIKIFDVRGALVKTLVNDQRQKGNHRMVWTGDNNQGGYVASGVYFYRLTAGQFRATKKMVLLR